MSDQHVKQKDRLQNYNIRTDLGVKGILQYVDLMQLKWFSHVQRMFTSQVVQLEANSTRLPHHPQKCSMDNIKVAAENRGRTLTEMERTNLCLHRRRRQTSYRLLA